MIKILALVIVATMVVTMSGCSKNEANITDQSVNNASVTEVVNEIEDSIVEDSNESTSSTETSTTESSTENSTVESTTKKTETTTVESTTKTKETTTSKNTTTKHTHTWKEVYKTVHHDAVTHTVHHDAETAIVGYKVGHQYATFKDGHTIDPYDYNYNSSNYLNALNNYQEYLMDNNIDCSYSKGPLVYHTLSVDTYNSTSWTFLEVEAQTKTVKDAYDETVVDKAAYDERVIDHYECSCGANK